MLKTNTNPPPTYPKPPAPPAPPPTYPKPPAPPAPPPTYPKPPAPPAPPPTKIIKEVITENKFAIKVVNLGHIMNGSIVKYNIDEVKHIHNEKKRKELEHSKALADAKYTSAEPFILKVVAIFNELLANKDFEIITTKEKTYLPNKWFFIPQSPIMIDRYNLYIKHTFTLKEFYEGIVSLSEEDFCNSVANFFSEQYTSYMYKEKSSTSIVLTLKLVLND